MIYSLVKDQREGFSRGLYIGSTTHRVKYIWRIYPRYTGMCSMSSASSAVRYTMVRATAEHKMMAKKVSNTARKSCVVT